MELIRDLEKRKIYLVENDKTLLETGRCGAEFSLCLSGDEPIIISKEVDESLYINLKQILENKYAFYNHGFSYQEENKIVWFSDQYCDMEDLEETDRVNRLILEDLGEQIKISCQKPYDINHGIKSSEYFVAFSPCGNGFMSRNLNTDLTFQDDIIQAFGRVLRCEIKKQKIKSKTRSRI